MHPEYQATMALMVAFQLRYALAVGPEEEYSECILIKT